MDNNPTCLMNSSDLHQRIRAAKAELASLENQLKLVEKTISTGQVDAASKPQSYPLPDAHYERYARQIIVPQIGLQGQLRLNNARILIIGLGGLGCPAAAYLAGAGIGTIGLLDGDVVDVSNLHRQIAHSTSRVGAKKVFSARDYLSDINPSVQYFLHPEHLSPHTALNILNQYDLVLDCTDHSAARYLISDTCVLAQKPLISASALKTEGQLMILNEPAKEPGNSSGGPCYRCIFPKPPPAESVVTCGEGGILGPVVGLMGVMQALEAIKLIASDDQHLTKSPHLLMFSAFNVPQFRHVKLRSRRPDCAACSSNAITLQSLRTGSFDYLSFCGVTQPVNLLGDDERISARECAARSRDGRLLIIDVRDKTHFDLCSIPNSVNIPISTLRQSLSAGHFHLSGRDTMEIAVICRLGNDSQMAVRALKNHSLPRDMIINDVKDGFKAWREEVDPAWPDY